MPDVQLTPEQREAVRSDSANGVILAAAGSGKTLVLTQRFLRLVQESGCSPSQILTITYTRKAAAGMKQRIVKALRDAGLVEQAQEAETGPISTMHSFCERILRENSFALGLDPEFRLETDTLVMAKEALRWLLTSGEIDAVAQAVVRELAGRASYGQSSGLDAKLWSLVHDLVDGWRATTLRPQAVLDLHRDEQQFLSTWLKTLADAANMEAPEGPFSASSFDQLVKRAEKRSIIHRWIPKTSMEALASSLEYSRGLGILAALVWQSLEEEMWRRQIFDFAAIEGMAIGLLRSDESVRERVGREFKAVLVDESQDINPAQYALLQALSVDGKLLVGDPQQCIYAFRHADPSLIIDYAQESPSFRLPKNHRSGAGILAFVDTVFRVIWGVDYHPMSQIDSDDPFGPAGDIPCEGVELWPMADFEPERLADLATEVARERREGESMAIVCRRNESLSRISTELTKRGVPNQVVGGSARFFTQMEIRDLANGLAAAADPYDDFSLVAFLRSPAVQLSLDAVVCLASRKPVFDALEDLPEELALDRERAARFLAWFRDLIVYADRAPAWEVISQIFTRSDLLLETARRPRGNKAVANLRKLLNLAAKRPETSARAYASELRQMDQLQVREAEAVTFDEDPSLVTIITVHKAKGLEWDIVVVPELFKKTRGLNRDAMLDPTTGLVAARSGPLSSPGLAYLKEIGQRQAEAEEQRILYVSLTRAKRLLCVAVDSQSSKRAVPANRIAQLAGYPDSPLPGLVIRERKEPPR